MSSPLKEKLLWLQGKKIAVAEPNTTQFAALKTVLEHYGVEVVPLNSVAEVEADLQKRRFATRRVFFAVFVDYSLAESVMQTWSQVTQSNPKLLKTPIILTYPEQQNIKDSPLLKTGYFRFCLSQPLHAKQVLKTLLKLNRWYGLTGEIRPSAVLQKEPVQKKPD